MACITPFVAGIFEVPRGMLLIFTVPEKRSLLIYLVVNNNIGSLKLEGIM